MSKRDPWLDRELSTLALKMALVLDEDTWHRTMKQMGNKDGEWIDKRPGSRGRCTFFEHPDGTDQCVVVSVATKVQEQGAPSVLSTLAHEAVHVWQEHCEILGEKSPGREQEAYAIQWIFGTLAAAYCEHIGVDWWWE